MSGLPKYLRQLEGMRMTERPDYSPRETEILKGSSLLFSTKWKTSEETPRDVTIKGFSGFDPDVAVVMIEGETRPALLMACGNTLFDGSIIGSNPRIWIREVL
jgi:hypothetical protein